MKTITFLLAGLLFTTSLNAQVHTFSLDISDGSYSGTPIPDYTKWYYFSFAQGDTVGTSEAVLENVSPANAGTEVINAEWKARADWDIAFHAADIRTNSGLSGNGAAGSLKIADATENTPTAEVFANLTEAPNATYAADELLSGAFIFGMTAMPPLRTAKLSAAAAANGWATVAMDGNTEKPTVIVFKTADGNYAKVHLKKFLDADGKPGFLEFDYQIIPLSNDETGISGAKTTQSAVYLNVASNMLEVNLSEKAEITVYTITGSLIKQINAQSGQVSISVSDWAKGTYIVKITDGKGTQIQKTGVK
jgi:hypothetical protein